MRPNTWEKVQEVLANFPALIQSLNKTALDEPKDNPKMARLLRDVLNEGIVLVKNDGALPLNKKEEIAYFGINLCDHFYVGYGSGGDVIPNYMISPVKALEERTDVLYNKDLLSKYKAFSKEHVPNKGVWGYWSTYYDEMPITLEEIKETKKTSAKAVVFVGRASGEGQDNLLESDQYYLNPEEKELIDNVISVYGKVVIVLNTGNINDFSWLMEKGDAISAIVIEWQGGMEAGHAIFDILYGDANPSAKLTDTVAKTYDRYACKNFGNLDGNMYSEDIYVGYRYFETFDPEGVLYPFGFGLSYTTFAVSSEAKASDGKIQVVAKVKNTGSVAGKEVVQLYVSKPNGILGNPSRELIEFAKTKLLSPGEEDTLVLSADIKNFASYDDSGITGHKSCFLLEEGEYSFYFGTDVRSAKKVGSYTLDKLIIVEQLREECSPQIQFDRMKRAMDGSLSYEKTPLRTINRKEDILKNMPRELEAKPLDIDFSEVMKNPDLMDGFIKSLSIEDLCALCHGEGPMRSKFGIAGNAGMFGGVNEELRGRGVPPIITTDGPSGIRANYHATLFPSGTALACSFNKDLAYQMGDLFGEEIEGRTNMILAPGLNIHRSMLCGRNFEYFSEDPYLTGVFATLYIKGIQKHGVSACPKHFACNNQELNRNNNNSIVSERALREIYLKCFEMVVKESKPLAIMTSYNKVNGVWSHYNNELVTNVLRKEWGFKGLVITDWWMRPAVDPDFPSVMDNAYRVRGGIDVLMPGSRINRDPAIDTTLIDCYKSGAISRGEIERCVKEILSFILTIRL